MLYSTYKCLLKMKAEYWIYSLHTMHSMENKLPHFESLFSINLEKNHYILASTILARYLSIEECL